MATEQRKDEKLFSKIYKHQQNICDTLMADKPAGNKAEGVSVVVEGLQYIYGIHDCQDLPLKEELTEIISRAYDADKILHPEKRKQPSDRQAVDEGERNVGQDYP